MKVVTWNLNGLRSRAAQVLELVDTEKPDVLCLQEVRATIDQIPLDLVELPGYSSYWHGGPKGYSGVALHLAQGLGTATFFHPDFDYESRIVGARVGDLTVFSVYVPNGGKDLPAKIRFLESLSLHLKALTGLVLVCGDINIARSDLDVHPKERKPRAVGQLSPERALLEQMLAHGYVDVQRALHPDDDTLFTWWAPWRNLRQRNIGWRIDYVLASRVLAERAVSCVSQREVGTSDHAPLVAVFNAPSNGLC